MTTVHSINPRYSSTTKPANKNRIAITGFSDLSMGAKASAMTHTYYVTLETSRAGGDAGQTSAHRRNKRHGDINPPSEGGGAVMRKNILTISLSVRN